MGAKARVKTTCEGEERSKKNNWENALKSIGGLESCVGSVEQCFAIKAIAFDLFRSSDLCRSIHMRYYCDAVLLYLLESLGI